MRKLLLLFTALLMAYGVAGCAVARKPAPPAQPRTVVVPESTRVSFERVDVARAPDVLKDVAKALENTDASTWVRSGNDIYLLISQGPRTRGYKVDITEIRQRNPRADFSWLDVKAKYTKLPPGQAAPTGPVFAAARVGRLDRPVNGVAFEFTTEEAPGPAGPPPGELPFAKKPAPAAPGEITPPVQGEAQISEPSPNQEVTSPVRIVGRARHPGGEVRLRLVKQDGRTLSETPVRVSRKRLTDFETSLSYTTPASPQPGFVEVLDVTRDEEKSLVRVPVTIK